MLAISVRLLNEFKNAVEVIISDDDSISPAEHNYIIRRHQTNNPANDSVYSLHQMEYEMSTNNGRNEYKFIETVDNRGVGHTYSATRINTTTFDEELSNLVEIIVAPNPVSNVVVNEALSSYNAYLELPTQICLEWDAYDTTTNNYDVSCFHIYYSLADHNCSNWSKPEKLRGLSTDDTTSQIAEIPTTDTSFYISVPQLTKGIKPKDMMLYLIAITSNKQSELSEGVFLETKEFVGDTFTPGVSTILTYGSKEDTDEQLSLTYTIKNPHYTISLSENAFDDAQYVWCERIELASELDGFDPLAQKQKILGWDNCYRYAIFIDGSRSAAKFSIYYPLKKMLRMDVRVNYGQGFVSIPYYFDKNKQVIYFSVTASCELVFIVKEETTRPTHTSSFTNATKRMIDRLPTWSKIRRKPTQSNGAYFLEIMGLEFETIESMMDYAQKQIYIPTSDMAQLGLIFKYKLPAEFTMSHSVAVTGGGHYLEQTDTLTEFMKTHFENTDSPEIYYNNLFMVDYDEGVIYTRRYYSDADVYIYRGDGDEPWYEEKNIPLEPHKVWNFFDEFGLLLDVERHNWEDNASYKERILDVFKNKSNASRDGLLNGIARELSRRTNIPWTDTSKDIVIKEKMVPYNKIKLNGEYLSEDKIWFTDEGYLLIKADPDVEPGSEISYVSGIELRTLHNKSDEEFTRLLYNPNGTATPLLSKYVNIIKDQVPIEWGKFHWNIGYWDTSLDEYGGVSFMPSLLDARIDGFYKE